MPKVTNEKAVKYWEETEGRVLNKNHKGIALTGEEFLFEKFAANISRNEEKYKRKGCHETSKSSD